MSTNLKSNKVKVVRLSRATLELLAVQSQKYGFNQSEYITALISVMNDTKIDKVFKSTAGQLLYLPEFQVSKSQRLPKTLKLSLECIDALHKQLERYNLSHTQYLSVLIWLNFKGILKLTVRRR